ncbi:hypothetical protein V7182_23820 [Neobacillus drentensis]|uniref:hypothetical protein n=1 Tax=Neobacillus drentensis TaxID=220684 RepID=UPI002FFD8228
MAKKRLGKHVSIPAEDEKDLMLKEYHYRWRKTNSDASVSYAPIFNAFRDKHLASLDGGPLKLYLFFAFAANNQYGHSWHSIQNISKFFDTQTRTIDNWIKVLVERNLIYRESAGKKSHTTYLIPYSNTIVKHQLRKNSKEDDQKLFERFINKIKEREFLYGSIVGTYHFFQWRTNKKNKPVLDGNTQWLVVFTKRDDGVLTGHVFVLTNLEQYGISELMMDDIVTFKSPFVLNGDNILGVGVTHETKLSNSNTDVLLTLMEDITNEEIWDWDEYPTVSYGELSEIYAGEDEKENEEEMKD